MKARTLGVALFVCGSCSIWATYTYYYSDALASVNTTNWGKNGDVSTGSSGLTSSTSGALISKVAGDGTSNYEVRTYLNLTTSGGNFFSYLRASSDALAGTSGTFYASEISPTFSGSTCTATVSILKSISGSISAPSSANMVPCHSGMEVRTVVRDNTFVAVYLDGTLWLYVNDSPNSTITTGPAGIGVSSAPAGNTISHVDLGPVTRIAPTFNPQQVTTSVFPNRVDIQWSGAVVTDPNGTGIAVYYIGRSPNYQILNSNTRFASTFSDSTVSPSTAYTYQIQAVDYDLNAAAVSFNVSTPSTGAIDPRQVGVRPLGTYWGYGGEQIDMRSGNLNYSVPLIKPMARTGWGVGFNLTYNSQNWRQDPGGLWQLGRDVGYGYGWKLLAGSIIPFYQPNWILDHYLFTDSTGAEYRLDQNNGGVWSSKESIYVYFDSNANPPRLYFRDGSFWQMGCTSAGTEQDAGTMYPTVMEDTNGNQITVSYNAGVGFPLTNSSARINQISDVRQTYYNGNMVLTYLFAYTNDPVLPHLTTISNSIHTAESYSFNISTGQPLKDPFTQTSFGTTTLLQSLTQTGTNLNTGFVYDPNGSGELNQMNTPYGGHIRWAYGPATYVGTRTQREVQNRYLSKAAGAAETTYSILRGDASPVGSVHLYARVLDPDGKAEKFWYFQTDATQTGFGLDTEYASSPHQGVTFGSPITNYYGSHVENYTWTTDTVGNSYISSTLTTEDWGNSTSVQKKTTQNLDQYGNVTQMQVYDFGAYGGPPQTTPARTYTNTYLTDTNYTSRYIRNRLLSSSVTDATHTAGLATITYDGGAPSDQPGMTMHDPAYDVSVIYRGNPITTYRPGSYTITYCDIGGNVTSSTTNNVPTTATASSANNYAVPSQLSTSTAGMPTLNTNLNWTGFLGLSSESGPNGVSASIGYDPSTARPTSSSSPFGASTGYTYNDTASPPTKTATSSNGHWVRTTMDGFGRTIKTESGDGGGTKSVVDTLYDSCGCSPIGKMKQVSQPYAPGGTPAYTTYNYDGLGRTTSTVAPDGSTTTYSYVGNSVKVTDPAGKWKQFYMDGMGNLTYVAEPDPTFGTVYTQYVYDVLNHLIQVIMTRGSNTQYRNFNYNTGNTVGALLLSAYNPENGTVTYTYNSNNLVATKTDANGQQFTYNYDQYNRLLTVSIGANVLRTYYYDTNQFDSSFSQNAVGRLTAIQYASFTIPITVDDNGGTSATEVFTDMFSYFYGSGGIAKKRLRLTRTPPGGGPSIADLDVAYSYNNEGKITNITYPPPNGGLSYSYSYDSMMRPYSMADQNNYSVVSSASYGAANELTQITITGRGTENRQYNSLHQLTNITGGGMNITYAFPIGANNGKIASQTDALSGETVSYAYDSLNRLISASSSAGLSQGYGYDGFGNLTSRTGTNAINTPAYLNTNRLSGYSYDNNGNLLSTGYTYDPENRLSQANAGGVRYSYDAQNKRIWEGDFVQQSYSCGSFCTASGWVLSNELVYLFGIDGKLLGSYIPQGNSFAPSTTRGYFGSRLVMMQSSGSGGTNLAAGPDRLGSGGTFYPYGEQKTAPPYPQIGMFATYTRDSGTTNLDYADQRYYSSQFGRFMTPDPFGGSAAPNDPQSWNRYSYAGDDPANRNDPSGLDGDDESNPALGCYFNGVWVAGCDVGFGLTRFVPQSPFTRATERLNAAVVALADRSNVSSNCQKDLDALSQVSRQDISLAAIQDALANTAENEGFKNGVGSTLPVSALGGPGAEAYGAAVQAQRDAKYGPGQTIGNDFARNPGGLSAETVLGGRTIFINPAVIGSSLTSNEGLLFHEALHELGLIDEQIQEALGFKDFNNVSNTKRITNKLQKDCITGKGNN